MKLKIADLGNLLGHLFFYYTTGVTYIFQPPHSIPHNCQGCKSLSSIRPNHR